MILIMNSLLLEKEAIINTFSAEVTNKIKNFTIKSKKNISFWTDIRGSIKAVSKKGIWLVKRK